MTAAPFLMLALLVLLLPVTGALMAATPFLMPRRECFAVTVPGGAAADPVLRRLKARYALIVGAATLLVTAAAVITLLANLVEVTVAIVAVGLVAVSLGGYGLMLYFRHKVRARKEAQGWVAAGTRSAALVGDKPSRFGGTCSSCRSSCCAWPCASSATMPFPTRYRGR